MLRRPRCSLPRCCLRRCLPAAAQETRRAAAQPTHFPIKKPELQSLVVRRLLRQLRSGAAAARLSGLQGSLRELPFAEARRLPQSRRRGRSAFQRGGGQGARRRATRSPTGRTTTATCSSGRAGRPTISRRPFANEQAAAAANGGAAPPDLSLIAKARARRARTAVDDRSISSPSTRRPGPTTSTRCSPASATPPAGVDDSRGHLLQSLLPQPRCR